ncbi:hypothetical protein AMECASPLE_025947 [Ameca splendens]|uniref:Uncharacterized protein n=1 Tax=Ameca splendens TaxID=208324 RepID=A0ABV0ZF03_9TELE
MPLPGEREREEVAPGGPPPLFILAGPGSIRHLSAVLSCKASDEGRYSTLSFLPLSLNHLRFLYYSGL